MPSEFPDLSDLLKPEDFGALETPPPPLLYKYMSADRITDVLEGGMVRFTHLLNTNDSFEVRKTFKTFAGPRLKELMRIALEMAMTPAHIEKKIKEKIAERGLRMSTVEVRKMLEKQAGVSIEQALRMQATPLIEMFAASFDRVKRPEDFLEELGSTLLCFSLSERFDLPAMWAHYGGGHTGIAVVFDTGNEWFTREAKPAESRLQKVVYKDEQLEEPFENLQAAFSSKTTDWAYEREWRLNCAMKQIEKTIDLGSDQIHLRSFPVKAVSGVIVGSKASADTIAQVRDILVRKYPHATLQRATPQRMTSTFNLEEI